MRAQTIRTSFSVQGVYLFFPARGGTLVRDFVASISSFSTNLKMFLSALGAGLTSVRTGLMIKAW